MTEAHQDKVPESVRILPLNFGLRVDFNNDELNTCFSCLLLILVRKIFKLFSLYYFYEYIIKLQYFHPHYFVRISVLFSLLQTIIDTFIAIDLLLP